MQTHHDVYAALGRERAELQALARLDREDRLLADRVRVLKRELRWLDDPHTPFSRAWAQSFRRIIPLCQAVSIAMMVAGAVVLAASARVGMLVIAAVGCSFSITALPLLFKRGAA